MRLRLPVALSAQNALAQLVATDPGVFARHHRYTRQQARPGTAPADRCQGPACSAPGASGLPEVELSVVAVLDALKADRPIDWNAAVTQLRAGGLSRYLAPYATATGAPGR